jgi:arylsulfatase A
VAWIALVACSVGVARVVAGEPPAIVREARTVRGWTVLVHRDLLDSDAAATTARALELLDAQLDEIERVVPAAAVAKLREVPLYLSPEYEGVPPRAEYHPDPGWLREHGRDPAMARAVEFTNVRIFAQETDRMPNFVLHELAHAYHHRVLPDGFGNADLEAAHARAAASGRYDAVERRSGSGKPVKTERAYALTTPQEFFAETTEAFFSRNDFFPFTKADLARHDPETTALLATLWGVVDAPAAGTRPNVVILYADDMGYGDLGANNPASKIPTPHLDRLAAEGMRFTDAHSSSGICSPSRYALLTGRHHWRDFHGIVNSLGPSVFKPGQLTLPAMLRDHGYATACVGKWHLGWDWNAIRRPGTPPKSIEHGDFDWTRPIPDGPLAHGFDTYFGDDVINFPPYAWIENDRVVDAPDATLDKPAGQPKEGEWECRPGPARSDWDFYRVLPTLTERAEAFVRSRQGNPQPFLLYFPLPSPHAPIIPNDEFDGRSQAGPFGDFVAQTDDACGRVLAVLRETGLDANTIVVFTADNGAEVYAYARDTAFDHWSSGPFRGIKRDLYEGGHHVPFLLKWPGVTKPGAVSDALVSQVDLMATLADAVGYVLPADAAADSHDLLPWLTGRVAEPPRTTIVHNTNQKQYAIRHGDWLLVDGETGVMEPKKRSAPDAWNAKHGYPPDDGQPVELYDLKKDVGQRQNLAAAQPEQVAELRGLLKRTRETERSAPAADERHEPAAAPAAAGAVKVYIMMGQSNMVGFGAVGPEETPGTLAHVVKEEGRFPHVLAAGGDWKVRDDVWCVQVTAGNRKGWLEPGFGARPQFIGPEFGFGHVIGDVHDEPVLLIKASQGNRSLGWDILPPGSERYTVDGRTYAGYKDTPDSWIEGQPKKEVDWYAGKQYDDFVRDTRHVLDNLDEFFPAAKGRRPEIAGFVWWQGHKDQNPVHAARYEQNLVRLIKELRKEFAAPDAPFVLATIAFGGDKLAGPGLEVAEAQLAVSGETGKHPEFAGNVKAVDARPFWREPAVSPAPRQGHHYHHNADTYLSVGDALGHAMTELVRGAK